MEKPKILEQLHKNFISELEKRYGKFESTSNKFELTSNSIIARDLLYSDSQFSRLIHNTASEGELRRAIENIERLLELDNLKKTDLKNTINSKITSVFNKKIFWVLLMGVLAITIFLFYNLKKHDIVEEEMKTKDEFRYEMLKWTFENKYIQPYIKLKELPDDCYYPCYKYQGKWELKDQYKIPFYRERNGFHYVAKEAIMYARCMNEKGDSGESFEGYEYQKHELWYDKREYPIDSFLTKGSDTKIRKSYNLSHFEDDENFIKIANMFTFFRTEFTIKDSLIYRTGKALGRDIEFVSDEILESELNYKVSIVGLKDEIKAISINLIKDYSKPISCNPSFAPNADFNLIKKDDEMSFNCHFITGNFLVDYNKTYIFKNQYINNTCR